MKIHFKYNLEMEWDNFQRGLCSKNHPGVLPKLAQEMADNNLNFNDKKVFSDFIQKKTLSLSLNPTKKISEIEKSWKKIEIESVKRMDKLFGQSLNHNITVYLTINSRCGYNIEQHYFFVNCFSKNTNLIILHELLHFYTYQNILPMFKEKNLNREQFNDFKEALTVLLNSNFSDLLEGDIDQGYEKQQDLRKYIKINWLKFSNVIDFSKFVLKNFKF